MSKRKTKNNVRSQKNKTVKYIPIYSKSDYEKDETNFNNSLHNNKINWSSFQRLMIHDLCTNTKILDTEYIGNIKLEDALFALKNPEREWRTLLAISKKLMHISPHYFRLNTLYSNMALFCWWVDLYDVKENANVNSIKKSYSNLVAKLENMNLKHEFSKIMKVLPYKDIYCGLVLENNTDFFFQEINYKICRIYQIQDGLYNFEINLSVIDSNNLLAYPDYVQKAYIKYHNGEISNWYLPPADKQICIKMNSQWTYPFPMLIGIIRDILDLDIYKKLKLQSARTDNFKAIMIKVPIDTKQIDKPLLTPEILGTFAEINRESLNEDIGMIHTLGSDGEAVSFKDSGNAGSYVSDAINELYNASGASKELFNGSSSGTAVTFSVENDSGFVYGVYRQFERWINRYIKLKKYNKNNFKFYFYLLDITIFNRDNVSKRYREACTLGATVVDKWLATLDITPSRMMGSYVLHKDIFDFQNNFKPLSSSYNTSTNDVGRPTNESEGKTLDVSGEQTQDSDANKDR